MNRRENLRSLFLGGISIPFLGHCSSRLPEKDAMIFKKLEVKTAKESPWHNMTDMDWAGPDYWGNRLQDWRVTGGKLHCLVTANNRTLHSLTHQIGSSRNRFSTTLHFSIPSGLPVSPDNKIGFILGATSDFQDYRAAAIRGKGLEVGVTTEGNLFVGSSVVKASALEQRHLEEGIILQVLAEPLGMKYKLVVKAYGQDKTELAQHVKKNIDPAALEGNLAILSDWKGIPKKEISATSCVIDKWLFEGDKLQFDAAQNFGPVCFAQYTKQQSVVKLTAQLMPVSLPSTAILEIRTDGGWKKVAEAPVDYPSYTAHFRLSDWSYEKPVPYRVGYDLKLKDGSAQPYYWEGSIAEEPIDKASLKALVFSCNFDYGFPDQEVVDFGSMHQADVIMFLGDQFYEPNGGFGIQRAPVEKAYLDYLRKWYQFGWSYRELFRHRPTINLPDDHDVFQGNLFGAGGKPFETNNTSKSFNRDHGGFMMPPEWVNLVMTTQTSHMPDPHDPEPAKQGIHVLYTDWKYAGVSFGLIEDRKFKSGPAAVLPQEAQIRDAFVTNESYEISKEEFPDAELIGKRQVDFLNHWIEDWGQNTELKILVSATAFHALQTLPEGAASNGNQRNLHVPKAGEYIHGDVPVADTDSGGWPQNKRNDLLEVVRKAFALHLAGDQHLPSVVQYGIDDWQDAGITFAVPALANSWPRRWYPQIPENHKPLPGQPLYTGNHLDAFGNKMHVIAVANPHQTGLEPEYLYDRSPGYGVVIMDKEKREIKMECWPRHVNPQAEPDNQFFGWPVIVSQQDNFNPPNSHFLPTINVGETQNPLIRVINEQSKELVHILRIRGNTYQPLVPEEGSYTIVVEDTERKAIKKVEGLKAERSNDQVLNVVL